MLAGPASGDPTSRAVLRRYVFTWKRFVGFVGSVAMNGIAPAYRP